MALISWKDLYSEIPGEFEGLFASGDTPWSILDNLKDFLRQVIRPNLPEGVQVGVPLDKPMVLLPGGWLDSGFELDCNDQTKGKIRVWIDGEMIEEATLVCAGAVFGDYRVQIGQGVLIEPGAMIKGPAIILDRVQVRQGAYMREDCLIGAGSVVGHATEVKHSIFLSEAKAGHFAYVGDSILGKDVNLGAGTKLANLKFGPSSVKIKGLDGKSIDTGRRKVGAFLGDGVQTGCNAVTNPGTVIGPGSVVASNFSVPPGCYGKRSVIR